MRTTLLSAAALASVMLVGAGCGPAARNEPPIVIQDERVYEAQTNLPPVQPPIKDGANGTEITAKFGQAVSLAIGETAVFTDGLNVTLKEIHDSRCPADVQCIWAGELAPVFVIKGGNQAEAVQIQLGTVRTLEGESDFYKIALNEANEASVTMTVTAKTVLGPTGP